MSKHRKVAAQHHEDLKSHAKELVKATGHIADASVTDARNRLSQLIESLSDKVEEAEDIALEKAREANEFVRGNPYKTAGIALGVGLLIGYAMSRRSDGD